MIVAIHQPHFLPWLGYLDRMRRADLFILLDHVQFERRNYQNRTRILLDGRAQWLTVPVIQRAQSETILEKRIDNPESGATRWWGANHCATLRHAYRKAPFFEHYANRIKAAIEQRHADLMALNAALLDILRDAFGIATPLVRSSELGVSSAKSALILDLCRAVGADAYLAGMGGSRDYLDGAAFAAAGIELLWQNFRHPRYLQCGGADGFVPGLSAVDLLFNHGPEGREVLRLGSVPATRQAEVSPA